MSFFVKEDGFTLLETIIAAAVLLMAFGALFPIFSSSYSRVNITDQRAKGLAIAQEKLTEGLLLIDQETFPKSGTDQSWDWEVTLEDFSHDSDSETAPGKLMELKVLASSDQKGIGAPVELKRIIWQQD